jgi:hypothetical protein
MELSLNQDEQDLLQQVLSSAFRDLRMEVSNTDNAEYRRELRAREASLKALLDRVGGLLDFA